MKIGMKLMAGFLMIALVMAATGFMVMDLGNQQQAATDRLAEESGELEEMNGFVIELSSMYSEMNEYAAAENDADRHTHEESVEAKEAWKS